MNESLVISGASGFVGQHLAAHAVARGMRVVCLARHWTTVPPEGAEAVTVRDYTDPDEVGRCIPEGASVVHLAARVPGVRSQADAFEAYASVNTEMACAFAQAAAASKARRFVFLSTMHVNGRNSGAKPFEESDPPNPFSNYGMSKLAAEEGLLELAAGTAMDMVIVRSPLVYGPGVKGNFARLIRLVASGVPLPLGRANMNRRSYVGVGNLTDFLITVATSSMGAGERFFVSDGVDVSTAELLSTIAECVGKPLRLIPVPLGVMRAGARVLGVPGIAEQLLGNLQVDLSKSRAVFDWESSCSLRDEVRFTVGNPAGGTRN